MLRTIKRDGRPHYYVRGTVAGQRVYESTGCSKKGDADLYARRLERQILDRHTLGKGATLTFAEAALTYMQRGGEARFLAPLIEHFGPETLVDEIDNAAVQAAADALLPGRAAATLNRQIATPISAVLTMAAEDGLARLRKIRRWKGDTPRTRWLTPEEAERLIAAAAPHILPAIAFMLGGGARSGEAHTITRDTFHAATGEAWLPETKNRRPRMIRLPRRAVDMALSRGLPEVGTICRTPKGRAYVIRENGGGQIAQAFGHAVEAARLDPSEVTPHVLRHTWATWFYAATADFGQLLDLGGWRKSDMANRYRKIAPDDLAERLQAHGWDFTRLGRNLPERLPEPGKPALRAVK